MLYVIIVIWHSHPVMWTTRDRSQLAMNPLSRDDIWEFEFVIYNSGQRQPSVEHNEEDYNQQDWKKPNHLIACIWNDIVSCIRSNVPIYELYLNVDNMLSLITGALDFSFWLMRVVVISGGSSLCGWEKSASPPTDNCSKPAKAAHMQVLDFKWRYFRNAWREKKSGWIKLYVELTKPQCNCRWQVANKQILQCITHVACWVGIDPFLIIAFLSTRQLHCVI